MIGIAAATAGPGAIAGSAGSGVGGDVLGLERAREPLRGLLGRRRLGPEAPAPGAVFEQRVAVRPDLRLGLRVRGGVRTFEDRAGVDLGQRLGDPVDGLAGALLGGAGALLGLGDPVEHLAQAPGSLDLLGLDRGELLGALRARLGLGGPRLDLLRAAAPRAAAPRRSGADSRSSRSSVSTNSRARTSSSARWLLELVLGPRQLGEQRLALRLVALGLGALALLGRLARRLGGLQDLLLGLDPRLLDPLLGLLLHSRDLLGATFGRGGRLRLARAGALALAAALGLGEPGQRLALGRLADRLLVG